MNWFKQLFSRRRLYHDLSEEIQEHLEEKIEELVASGMPRKEAAPRPSPSSPTPSARHPQTVPSRSPAN